YIKISSEGIELGTQDNIYLKCNVLQKMGTAQKKIQNELPSICKGVQEDSAEKHAIIVERK
ncbi:hypothetical protein GQ597_11750, partial [Gilliamella sp. Pra-s65]|uniref:DUF2345 domain-containing protein n=1 Tax=unclassified Gilliamella TaxID=2685620 RepID=UPI001365BEF1